MPTNAASWSAFAATQVEHLSRAHQEALRERDLTVVSFELLDERLEHSDVLSNLLSKSWGLALGGSVG